MRIAGLPVPTADRAEGNDILAPFLEVAHGPLALRENRINGLEDGIVGARDILSIRKYMLA